MKSTSLTRPKDNLLSVNHDVKHSGIGNSGGITYSTLANIPRAKKQKLISEAKPLVS